MKVAIIGTGYVGLVTGVGLAKRGHHVTAHDIDPGRLKTMASAKAPFFEPDLDNLFAEAIKADKFTVTPSLPVAMKDADVSIIAVGTPSTENGIDLTAILEAANAVGTILSGMTKFHVVAIKSTVVPGTTDTAVKEALEKASGKKAGKDFGIGMVPEFLREGHAVEDFLDPDRIIIGADDPQTRRILTELFSAPHTPVVTVTPRNAEMIKYTSNALLATLISFSNEISSICEKIPGLSEEAVMEGLHLDGRFASRNQTAKHKPAILSYLRGGIGFGGSCFPKDVKALREFAKGQNAPTRLLDAVLAINESRSQAVIDLLTKAIGPLKGKRIAVAGLSFKENTDDIRESPGIKIVNALCRLGANIVVHDPAVHGKSVRFDGQVEVAQTVESALIDAEACIIATRWPQYITLPWTQLVRTMKHPVVLDGRQVVPLERRIEPMIYVSIGMMPVGMVSQN